jgi:hypothetical protein
MNPNCILINERFEIDSDVLGEEEEEHNFIDSNYGQSMGINFPGRIWIKFSGQWMVEQILCVRIQLKLSVIFGLPKGMLWDVKQ